MGKQGKQKVFKRDLLRWEDSSQINDLTAHLKKVRVDDKVAFKHKGGANNQGKSQSREKSSPSKAFRPLSEPNAMNKKNINYRIKNKVIKR